MRFVSVLLALIALPSINCASSSLAATTALNAPVAEAVPLAEFDHSHKLLDQLLVKHVANGWLDYKGVIADRKLLRQYINQLKTVTPDQLSSWTREQRYAFWINTYNAHVIRVVINNYPLRSIKDIGGAVFNVIWDKEFIELTAHHPDGDDDMLSLNDVEHKILRPRFKDARVHAAVNCASYSCPVLMNGAFTADKLEEQLERQMRGFVNDSLRNTIDVEGGKLQISEIFKWFEDDFKRDHGSINSYLAFYVPAEFAEFVKTAKIRYLDYDWSLNDIEANRK
ncbi:MAG: hypothetical protein ACI8TQ_001364 [Planctomycetota bacterium]|jgi:hypothetical protein